jgi:hypothetical protein
MFAGGSRRESDPAVSPYYYTQDSIRMCSVYQQTEESNGESDTGRGVEILLFHTFLFHRLNYVYLQQFACFAYFLAVVCLCVCVFLEWKLG